MTQPETPKERLVELFKKAWDAAYNAGYAGHSREADIARRVRDNALTYVSSLFPERTEGEDEVEAVVTVIVSGLTAVGKSAIAGEIEVALKALGLDVYWRGSQQEKNATHADWAAALELYHPRVVIREVNLPRKQPIVDSGPLNQTGGSAP